MGAIISTGHTCCNPDLTEPVMPFTGPAGDWPSVNHRRVTLNSWLLLDYGEGTVIVYPLCCTNETTRLQ